MKIAGGPLVELKIEWYDELLYSFLNLGIDSLSVTVTIITLKVGCSIIFKYDLITNNRI